MKTIITSRKITLRENFKDKVDKKLSKIERFFAEDAQANVTVALEKDRYTVELTIKSGSMIFRSEDTSFELDSSFDKVVNDIIRKIRKNKTKVEKKLKKTNIDEYVWEDTIPEETDFHIVRTKKFKIEAMNIDDAVLRMNMLGHEFYMFKNQDSGMINVVYRRNDGDYGLIESEN